MMDPKSDRRDILRLGAGLGATVALGGAGWTAAGEPAARPMVRAGLLGDPYSRRTLVQGTRGIVRRFPEFQVSLERKAHAEGDRPEYAWEPGASYLAEYEQPLGKRAPERSARESGRAGGKPAPVAAESLEDSRLIEALRAGVAPDFDVYDAATWSAVAPLSEKSVADRSRPADVPDFTRGRWKTNQPVRIPGV